LCRLQRALPDVPFFNILYSLRVTSAVDVAILERSLNEIVRRHEILRTTFAIVDDRYVQVIAPELNVRLILDDLRALPESEKETVGHQIFQEEAHFGRSWDQPQHIDSAGPGIREQKGQDQDMVGLPFPPSNMLIID
jgi:hypothetical protein